MKEKGTVHLASCRERSSRLIVSHTFLCVLCAFGVLSGESCPPHVKRRSEPKTRAAITAQPQTGGSVRAGRQLPAPAAITERPTAPRRPGSGRSLRQGCCPAGTPASAAAACQGRRAGT